MNDTRKPYEAPAFVTNARVFDSTNPMFKYIPALALENGQLRTGLWEELPKEEDPSTVQGSLFMVLIANGLFAVDARTVLERAYATNDALALTRYKKIAGYPELLYRTFWVIIKTAAINWMDELEPEHFARELFK